MTPKGIQCVIPSRVGVGEAFALRVRILGETRPIPCVAQWNTVKPALHGPFNLNVQRQIQYHDNCLPEWCGTLAVEGGTALSGPASIDFNGTAQGVFPGDARPIASFPGFHWTQPGFHFVKLVDRQSGVTSWSNPVYVTPTPPGARVFWGDPHWQTFFSDGIRCPEELYAFARDEAFLDFGAITDHVEALTDRQWEYFVGVTNDFDDPGRFATLVGQEWTKHHPGHRNVYFRGDHGPILRCTDPRYDTLEKLWAALDGLEAIAIPHHPANRIMGVDWECGWNPRYETAVEIYSVWGNSERPGAEGNPRPIRHCQGEMPGRHVRDALALGYRFGFVGGGDIHDGRPGDGLSHLTVGHGVYPQGLTAAFAPACTRADIFAAMRRRSTYATTLSRIYLDVQPRRRGNVLELRVNAASEEGIADAVVVRGWDEDVPLLPGADQRVIDAAAELGRMPRGGYCYVRVTTQAGNLAWSSPVWSDDVPET